MLVAVLLARANRRCTSGSPFWFRRSRGSAYDPAAIAPASPSRRLCSVRQRGSRRTKCRHGFARARRLTRRFATAPLQSLQPCITPEQHRLHAWLTLLRSDGRKLARQSEQLVRAPQKSKTRMVARLRPTRTRNMAARLRPAKAPALRREAPPAAEDISISPRGFARARRLQ